MLSCVMMTLNMNFLFGESILAEIIISFLHEFLFMRIEAYANVQLPFDAKFGRDFDARVGVITLAYATRINFECFENLK